MSPPPSATTQFHWIDAKVRLPPEGEQVLGWWPWEERDVGLYGVCVRHGRMWHSPENDEDDYAPPTYWTAIAEVPRAQP